MRFNKPSSLRLERALDALVTTDQILVLGRKAAGALALFGLIVSGLYLRYSNSEGIFSYSAVRGLHWLFGLVLLMDYLFWLVQLIRGSRAILAGLARRQWPFPPVPGSPIAYALVAAGYWATLAIVLVTGIEAFLETRYGFSILPHTPPLAWAKVHSMAFFYLPGFLLLRLFYWTRAYLIEIRPYLRSP